MCRSRAKGEVNRNEVQLLLGKNAQRFARRRDRRRHLVAASHGLRAHRGVDPRFGLYSAIVVTLVASIFGSSSHLINGPTNAISLVVFSALGFFNPDARLDAYQAMFLLGIMIGCIQILIAIFKLGDLTRYISESVVIGFMAGAGTLVGITQLGNLTGLRDRGTGSSMCFTAFGSRSAPAT
jgi:MFS superfamily sulfate permease-like transporter